MRNEAKRLRREAGRKRVEQERREGRGGFELVLSYPLPFLGIGPEPIDGDDLIVAIVGERDYDSGIGGGQRDLWFRFDTEDEARKAVERIEQSTAWPIGFAVTIHGVFAAGHAPGPVTLMAERDKQ